MPQRGVWRYTNGGYPTTSKDHWMPVFIGWEACRLRKQIILRCFDGLLYGHSIALESRSLWGASSVSCMDTWRGNIEVRSISLTFAVSVCTKYRDQFSFCPLTLCVVSRSAGLGTSPLLFERCAAPVKLHSSQCWIGSYLIVRVIPN